MLIFPYQLWARLYMRYSTVFMLSIFMNIAFALLAFIAGYCLLYAIRKHLISYRIYHQLVEERGTSAIDDGQNDQEYLQQRQPQPWIDIIIGYAVIILYSIMWATLSLFYFAFFAIGWLGRGILIDISTVIVMLLVVLIPNLMKSSKTNINESQLGMTSVSHYSSQKQKRVYLVTIIAVWLAACVTSVVLLKGVCLCSYNDNYGIIVGQGSLLSTEYFRAQHIGQVCAMNDLCHLYATLPEETDKQVFINVHTGLNVTNLTITLSNQMYDQLSQLSSNDPIVFDHVEYTQQRNVHSVLFKRLRPATIYELKIVNSLTGHVLKVTNYRTVPSKDAEQIRLAVGGDVAMTVNGSRLTQYLVNFDPDVILIGGDITYDDAMRACSYSWDNFYWIFQQLDLKLNRTVPLILTIGNHDVGYDAFSTSLTIRQNIEQIPLYFLFNPQHLSSNTKQIPVFYNRSSIHYHLIGNTVHLHLDSGYILPFPEQAEFIKNVSSKYKSYYKFGNYHNPLFPTCYDLYLGSNDDLVIKKGFQYWTPLFDQFNFIAAMEHHTHHRKFTKKIRNRNLHQGGVRYIGDGSWGIPQPSCRKDRITRDVVFFQDLQINDPNHIWQIIIKRQECEQQQKQQSQYQQVYPQQSIWLQQQLKCGQRFQQQYRYWINYTSVDLNGQVVFQKIQPLPAI